MALETVADLIANARVLLQDRVEPYRYETDQLVAALNIALQDARRIRPDIFLPDFIIPTYSSADLSASIKFPEFYRSALLYFVCGMAHMRDEEETSDARVTQFMGGFIRQLTGSVAASSGSVVVQ